MAPQRIEEIADALRISTYGMGEIDTYEATQVAIRTAVREALEAAATECWRDANADAVDGPYNQGWAAGKRAAITVIRRLRDELAPPP